MFECLLASQGAPIESTHCQIQSSSKLSSASSSHMNCIIVILIQPKNKYLGLSRPGCLILLPFYRLFCLSTDCFAFLSFFFCGNTTFFGLGQIAVFIGGACLFTLNFLQPDWSTRIPNPIRLIEM